jgi:hypothetical protein
MQGGSREEDILHPQPLHGANILRLASYCGARISFCGTTSLRIFADIVPLARGRGDTV